MSYWHWCLGLKIKKVWYFLANLSFEMDYIILFCFGKTHYRSFFFLFFLRDLFALLDNIYFVENKYVMCELLYNIKIYITCFLATIKFSFFLKEFGRLRCINYQIYCIAHQPKKIQSKTSSPLNKFANWNKEIVLLSIFHAIIFIR